MEDDDGGELWYMVNYEDQTTINNLRSLVAYFVLRQSIVFQVMLDVNPIPLRMGGEKINGIDIEPYVSNCRLKEALASNYSQLRKGLWKEEWEYRTHGRGCFVISIKT